MILNENTVFKYQNSIGEIVFAFNSPFWIEFIDGISSVGIDISASQSNQQVGSTLTNQSVQPRAIPIDGCIFDPLEQSRRKLIEVIAPQIPARLIVIEGTEEWYLDVVPEETPNIYPGNGVQNFQMQLYAAYPYWQTTKEQFSQVGGIVPLFEFPFSTGGEWYISKYDDNIFKEIENKGNAAIGFRVVFAARSRVLNPSLYHVGDGKGLYIKKEMLPGEKFIISTRYGQIFVQNIDRNGNVSNGWKYLTIDSDLSMRINSGINLFRADADENKEGIYIRIEAPEGVVSGV